MMWRQLLFGALFSFAFQQGEGKGGTCMYKWMRRAEISANRSRDYEEAFRVGSVTEALVKQLPSNLLSFAMKGDRKSALAVKNCIQGTSEQCAGYNPCQQGGECMFSHSRRVHTCKCREGLRGDLCEIDLQKHYHQALQNITKAMHYLAEQMTHISSVVKELEQYRCKPNPCKNGGRCDSHTGTCSCPLGYFGKHCKKELGKTRRTAAKSCADIQKVKSEPNGTYWIKPPNKAAFQVYCDLKEAGGGWMKVADINPRRDNRCPANIQYISSPKPLCINPKRLCTSVFFSTHGISYSEVRGFAYGYQYNTTDAFWSVGEYGQDTIDGYYVDGLSITHGRQRKHIWTFAAGFGEGLLSQVANCPCAKYPGRSAPSFVGSDYYCESGNPGSRDTVSRGWHKERLWDGKCHTTSNCCTSPNMPNFMKSLGGRYTNRLEVRFCTSGEHANENVGVEELQLFVR